MQQTYKRNKVKDETNPHVLKLQFLHLTKHSGLSNENEEEIMTIERKSRNNVQIGT